MRIHLRQTVGQRYHVALASAVVAAFVVMTAFAQVHSPLVRDRDILLYARWLRADEVQRDLMRAFHAEYYEEVLARHLDDLQALNRDHTELFRELHRRENMGRVGEIYRTKHGPLNQRIEEMNAKLAVFEEHLFRDIESLLSDEQLRFLPRVRDGRRRLDILRRVHELPEGMVDLVMLIDSLPLSAEEYDRIEAAFILDYEPQHLAVLEDSLKARRNRNRVLYLEIYDLEHGGAVLAASGENPWDIAMTAVQLRQREGRRRIAACERVLNVVRQGKSQLLALLPEELRPELERQYLEAAYPNVYPDPLHAARLYDAVMSLEDLTDVQRIAIEFLHVEYERQHALLSAQMARDIHDRMWGNLAFRPHRRGDVDVLWVELFSHGAERERLNLRQVDRIRPILLPEQMEQLPMWEFAAHERPRPWDHNYENDREQTLRRMEMQRLIDEEMERRRREEEARSREGDGYITGDGRRDNAGNDDNPDGAAGQNGNDGNGLPCVPGGGV